MEGEMELHKGDESGKDMGRGRWQRWGRPGTGLGREETGGEAGRTAGEAETAGWADSGRKAQGEPEA